MKISKDEARVFADLIYNGMHELASRYFSEKQKKIEVISGLEN